MAESGAVVLRRVVRRLFERASGYEVEHFGTSYALIDSERRSDAWFSQRTALRDLFAQRRISLVIDVGANTGQFASGVREFFSGPVHSFEPVAATHARLAERAAGDDQWFTHQFALGGATTTAPMHLSAASDFSSLLVANPFSTERFGERARQTEVESVSVRRLEDVLPEITASPAQERIFLKMDTQGYDSEVFRGAGRALDHVVAMQSEISLIPLYDSMPHWADSIGEYERAGFGVVGLYPVSTEADQVIEYDCLMSRRR